MSAVECDVSCGCPVGAFVRLRNASASLVKDFGLEESVLDLLGGPSATIRLGFVLP